MYAFLVLFLIRYDSPNPQLKHIEMRCTQGHSCRPRHTRALDGTGVTARTTTRNVLYELSAEVINMEKNTDSMTFFHGPKLISRKWKKVWQFRQLWSKLYGQCLCWCLDCVISKGSKGQSAKLPHRKQSTLSPHNRAIPLYFKPLITGWSVKDVNVETLTQYGVLLSWFWVNNLLY